ncbi:hypothetical protein [Nannocystis sp.]|uniref:hypothetical protein n=1 Tax=Nannocystis sp. TaxID=1962667 RepID=UPI0025CE348A|nr:hypothetical protein [Nannocystis sp.]MBK7823803.1 hypothetical protein [Nannocystis sp.]
MTPRTLAAAALLAAGCFVDNRPGISASDSGNTDPASSTTAHTPPTSATGEPSSGPDTSPTSSDSTSTSTTTGTPGSTSTTSVDISSSGDATTMVPPGECPAVGVLGGAVSLKACATCVTAECCELLTMCAQSDPCTTAWACISDEPCVDKWPGCPGALESVQILTAISNCIQGPCAEFCPIMCGAQEAACAANPECTALDTCVSECTAQCLPGDNQCLADCQNDCALAHVAGVVDWKAMTGCHTAQCGG